DFSREMVVAVLAGYIPSFGNSIETRRLVHDDATDELRIDFVVNHYRGGAAPPQMDQWPYQILRVVRATGAIRTEVRAPLSVDVRASGGNAVYLGAPEVQVARDAATLRALVAA